MMIRATLIRLMLLCVTVVVSTQLADTNLFAQENTDRWEQDIKRFEAATAENPPPEGACLFVGSSSIRLWPLEEAFPDLPVINRGFGGSQTSDVNQYFDRLVLPLKPGVVITYVGDNDVADGKTVDQVAQEHRRFFDSMTKHFPDTPVIFIPIKPSLARWEMWPEMNQANQKVREIVNEQPHWHYTDIVTPMLGVDGTPSPELFVDDGLHLNKKGYEVWNRVVGADLKHALAALDYEMAQGTVYHDANNNQRFDSQDSPLEGVKVSNGRDIVTTDERGEYTIPVDNDDIVFVMKPRGYRTPLTREMLPKFYYIHKPAGSPESRFPGVAATGELPESIDFALYPQSEPERFEAIMFGDPQPRNQKEVEFVTRDVVEELVGTKAAFGVTLGDITFDNLALFETQNQAIALLGIPWYNVIGNHDVNREATSDDLSDESFERVYGPAYYSFDYGPTHFIVLDNIDWIVNESTGKPGYRAGLGPDQLRFVREDIARIPEDQLVVLMMHIPIISMHDREQLFRIIEHRPFCMSISGHTHHHEHRFVTRADGWRGVEPHHHVINVCVSGSWWGGIPDERGIPHTMMADGAPNGYSIIRFDGQQYRVDFRAAGRPADYQMSITVPNEVSTSDLESTVVFANVFNGSERTKVEMKLGTQTQWQAMTYSREADPHFAELSKRENEMADRTWTNLPNPKPSPHLWKLEIPTDLKPGVHLIQIQATDEHGEVFTAGRAIRIVE